MPSYLRLQGASLVNKLTGVRLMTALQARLADPYFDEGMHKWIMKTASSNLGRIANFSLEDLIQEGLCCYWKCRNTYVGKIKYNKRGELCRFLPETNPDKTARKHLFCLVQTSFHNRLATLAYKQPSGWEMTISSLFSVEAVIEEAWEKIVPPAEEELSIGMLIKQAPSEFKQLFDLLISDAMDIGYRRYGRGKKARRETTNQRFCRLLGITESRDLSGELESYFMRR